MRVHRLTFLIICIAFICFIAGNGILPITDPVESNYALTAKEMVISGDWLSPQIYGQYWFDKPIMIYWLIALSYKIFGFSDFASRLPSSVFAALSVGLMYQIMRSASGRRVLSLLSAGIMGTSLLFMPVAHGIITDMVLLFATVGTLGYAYRGLVEDKISFMVSAYIFAGVGVLTKGPVALVLPGILLLVFAGIMRSGKMFRRIFSWQGILAFIIVCAPWYIYMYYTHGQAFLDGFLGLNNVVRATQSEHPEDNFWWYYLALFPLGSLPWTGSVIYGMIQGWRKKTPFYMYCMVMGWGIIVFYSLMATKYPLYTFVSIVPFSALGALGVVNALRPGMSRKVLWTMAGPALFFWGLLTVASFFVNWGFWYLLYVVTAVAVILLLHFMMSYHRYMVPVTIAVGTLLIFNIVLHEGLVPVVRERSSVELIPIVEQYDGDVYFYDAFATSMVYYTGRHAVKINAVRHGGEDLLPERSAAWNGKYRMEQIEESDFNALVDSGKPLMLVVPKGSMKYFEHSPLKAQLEPFYKSKRNTVYIVNKMK